MEDLDKLIVAKGFKSCPKSNKSPNLVTLLRRYQYDREHSLEGGRVTSSSLTGLDWTNHAVIWTYVLKILSTGAVVVAQLAERLLPIPEDPGSNPVIGNFY